jgi:hypothetical protein
MVVSAIPPSLSPFFQEYDLTHLDPVRSASTIIERTLRYGTRAELRWLFSCYSLATVANWVGQWGQYGLPEPHLTFWKLILDVEGVATHD